MLVQNFIVETGISNSKACKLASVAIRILAALDCSFNQSMLEKLLVEIPGVTAQVTNQVANLGSNASIIVANQCA